MVRTEKISHFRSQASQSPDTWPPYLTFLLLTVPHPAPVQALACPSDLASEQSQVKPHDLVVTDKTAGVRPAPSKGDFTLANQGRAAEALVRNETNILPFSISMIIS